MSPAVLLGFAVFLVGAVMFLAQLWLQPWSPETFVKLILTDGVALAIVVIGGFALRERRESERLRNRQDLD